MRETRVAREVASLTASAEQVLPARMRVCTGGVTAAATWAVASPGGAAAHPRSPEPPRVRCPVRAGPALRSAWLLVPTLGTLGAPFWPLVAASQRGKSGTKAARRAPGPEGTLARAVRRASLRTLPPVAFRGPVQGGER